ncbi:hypothetical protein AVEN_84672-1 [Araneus ventricosus]|uniref:Uncharacterized protein n=1 Tax=Araneus ventricosus TaxID=182803 RepID=A0A4Y2UFW0_ARAVE|nr:hypothetical protein AVEN_84672-1 [Araneus ventricosus]
MASQCVISMSDLALGLNHKANVVFIIHGQIYWGGVLGQTTTELFVQNNFRLIALIARSKGSNSGREFKMQYEETHGDNECFEGRDGRVLYNTIPEQSIYDAKIAVVKESIFFLYAGTIHEPLIFKPVITFAGSAV